MAWVLDIHVIDVGAGDSSLIVAEEPVAGHLTTMLIDGGLTSSAQTVYNKITTEVNALDTILVSHYDIDHSIGVVGMLLADNLWRLCDIVTGIAIPALPLPGYIRADEVARMAARATAAALGATALEANPFGVAATIGLPAASTDAQAADEGVHQLQGYRNGDFTGAALVPRPISRGRAASAASVAAIGSIVAGHALGVVQATFRTALFTALRTAVPQGARFETGGMFHNTTVIDIGNTAQSAPSYNLAVTGGLSFAGTVVPQVPGLARARIQIPALGSEVLWGAAGPPAANAPVAIVISTPLNWGGATTGTGWRGPNPPNAPANFQGGTPGNCASIGVVLRFGNFTHYSAGDLPSTGEDLIGDRLVNRAFPDGYGGLTPALPRIVSLKASHHGSAESSSNHFVGTVAPFTAAISCGLKHNHPTQRVIDTLNGVAPRIYLTNCNYPRLNVPFSTLANQITTPGNRAFVSGDNVTPNNAPGRNRGDIRFHVTQANATAVGPPRHYDVQYWEQLGGGGFAGPAARNISRPF